MDAHARLLQLRAQGVDELLRAALDAVGAVADAEFAGLRARLVHELQRAYSLRRVAAFRDVGLLQHLEDLRRYRGAEGDEVEEALEDVPAHLRTERVDILSTDMASSRRASAP